MNTSTCSFISQHFWEIPIVPSENHPLSQALKNQLTQYIQSLIEDEGVSRFMVLMDSGIPLFAAATILELRTRYPISLVCVIPYEEQHIFWSEEERNRYFSILEQCDKEHMLQQHFSLDCYQRSNKYMVSHASILFVFYNGRPSDTRDAIHEAQKKGRSILVLSTEQLYQSHA